MHWRLPIGIILWLAAMFSLAVAAEGIGKGGWITTGAVPITALAAGFIVPRRTVVVPHFALHDHQKGHVS